MCVPPVSWHSPFPHQPAGTEAGSDRLCCQSARLLLPQKLLVTARVPPVLHTWTGRKTASPLQGLYTKPNTQLYIFNYCLGTTTGLFTSPVIHPTPFHLTLLCFTSPYLTALALTTRRFISSHFTLSLDLTSLRLTLLHLT